MCTMRTALTVVLTVVVVVVHAVLASPVYHANMDELRLLEQVLGNEHDWRLVLKEHVRGLDDPPFAERFPGVVLPAPAVPEGGGAAAADPRAIAAAVVPRLANIGSYVKWAARAVHLALTCHATRHMAFQAHYVSLLVERRLDPADVVAQLAAFRNAVARVLDKLAAVPSDLDVALDTYWELMRLGQDDAVQHVRPKSYPKRARRSLDRMHKLFAAYVDEHCARPYKADRQLFDDAGVEVPDELLLDEVLGAVVSDESLVRLGHGHAVFLSRYYRDLGVETMPRPLWTQLFYHARRLPPSNPQDRTNPRITRRARVDLAPAGPAIAVNVITSA